jgi:hypothetical protein
MKQKIKVCASASYYGDPKVLEMLKSQDFVFTSNERAVRPLTELLPAWDGHYGVTVVYLREFTDPTEEIILPIVAALRNLNPEDIELVKVGFGEINKMRRDSPATEMQ